jgi:serine/threonine-protein kinase
VTNGQERRIGPWLIQERLGAGGNATVWLASREHEKETVALKVLNSTKLEREPYQRFVREIGFLQSLESFEGVLAIIDSHLPDAPSTSDRAWLAMPVATPMTEALADSPLDEIVRAMQSVASTLARLQDEKNVAHRDIKPGNLYEKDGLYLIGDFGLVTDPDASDLTRKSRPVGPLHFTAYELLQSPTTADPFPADVYSFGKTLWVLATAQRFPPEGHQPIGSRGFSIGDFRPHPHAPSLDQLVDRATRLHAEERPTMKAVAEDLLIWQQLSVDRPVLDVTEVRSRLHEKMRSELAEQDRQDQLKEQALASVRRMQELTRPLNEALKQVHPRAELDATDDELIQNILRTPRVSGTPDITFRWQRTSRIGVGEFPRQYLLRMGRSLELAAEGVLILRTMLHVGLDGVMQNDFHWQSAAPKAPVGSVAAEKLLENGIAELAARLQEALNVFVEKAPSPKGQ